MRAIASESAAVEECLEGGDLEAVSPLAPEIRRLICERGWRSLTPAQRMAIPRIAAGDNVLVMAPTGYGKTEAAVLPVLSQLASSSGFERGRGVYVLYITPLKALINDLTHRIDWWASRLGIRVGRKHGDVPQVERMRRLKILPEIMITTPESLEIDLDWSVKFRRHYSTVSWVIIDEVHELVGTKRGAQLSVLLERLHHMSGRDFQRIMLSASVGDPEAVARYFTGSSSRRVSIVRGDWGKDLLLSVTSSPGESIEEGISCVAGSIEPISIVFTNSRYVAERIHEGLEKTGCWRMAVHHSSVSHEIRESVEESLRRGDIDVVIATKTLELGIDIGKISRVIMFRPPGQVVSLIQRIGRSGHSVGEISRGVIVSLNEMDTLLAGALASLLSEGYMEKPLMIEAPLDVLAREIVGWVLRGGSESLDVIYRVIRRAYPFRNLEWGVFAEVVSELVDNGVLEYFGNNSVKLGRGFYTVWRFDQKWKTSRSFTEFFTFLSDSNMFSVRAGERVVGYLDDQYVYRILRAGDVVRIGGRLWRVQRIDEDSMSIEVVQTDEGESTIPLWKGEAPSRSRAVAERFYELLSGCCSRPSVLDEGSWDLVERAASEMRSWFSKHGVPVPSRSVIVVEDLGDEEVILYPFGDKMAEALGYLLLYTASKREGIDVGVRITPIGVSLRVRSSSFKDLLAEVGSGEGLEDLVSEALKRSPRLSIKIKEIQHSFGVMGRVPEGSLIFREAVKQVVEELESEGSLKELFSSISNGGIKIYRVSRKEPSPLSRRILASPLVRPWLRDLGYLVAKLLKGFAMTVGEIAEALELPEKFVENKLKDMRKSAYYRVVQFKDVDTGEWRWALAEDLEDLSRSPEFQSCFAFEGVYGHVECSLRYDHGTPQVRVVFRTSDLESGLRSLMDSISSDEIYEVKVAPLSVLGSKDSAVTYYNVPKEALPYVVRNALAYMEKMSSSY